MYNKYKYITQEAHAVYLYTLKWYNIIMTYVLSVMYFTSLNLTLLISSLRKHAVTSPGLYYSPQKAFEKREDIYACQNDRVCKKW